MNKEINRKQRNLDAGLVRIGTSAWVCEEDRDQCLADINAAIEKYKRRARRRLASHDRENQ